MLSTPFDLMEPQEKKSKNITVTEDVFVQLRDDIISGKYSPGSKLGLEQLRTTYGVGSSPLREALSRLAANGLVRQEIQRGFSVASATIKDLQDITENRVRLESLALQLAIGKGDDHWECQILSTHHLLAKQETLEGQRDPDAENKLEKYHQDFHLSLIEACDSYWLLHFCRLLYDQFHRYRRMSENSPKINQLLKQEHEEIVQLALARNVDHACRLLSEHIHHASEAVMVRLSAK